MDKKSIWIVVAIIILAFLAYFFLFSKKSVAPGETSLEGANQTTSQSQTAQNSSAGPQSLMDLVAGGKSLKCTFNENGSDGTIYVSGGKTRGDFMASKQKGHMVMMDNTSYVWMDGASQGFKSSVNTPASPSEAQSQGVDSSKKMNYSCSPWSADATMFALPASVQFMDASNMMKVPTK